MHALESLFLGNLFHLALVNEMEVALEGLFLLLHDLMERLLLLHLSPHFQALIVPVAPLELPHPVLCLDVRRQLLEVLPLPVRLLLRLELPLPLVDLDLVLDDGAPLVDLAFKGSAKAVTVAKLGVVALVLVVQLLDLVLLLFEGLFDPVGAQLERVHLAVNRPIHLPNSSFSINFNFLES